MRYIVWEDEDGFYHRSLIRMHDADDKAPCGLPADPPGINELDWETIQDDLYSALEKRELPLPSMSTDAWDALRKALHNELVVRGLFVWQDVVEQQTGITGAILSATTHVIANRPPGVTGAILGAFRKEIVSLYRRFQL